MTLLEQLGDIAKRGVDLIEEAYAAADLPLPADHARELRRTAEAFLAPTSHSRYQRRTLAAARRNQHSLATLALIARRSQRVKNPTERWRFRETLCATAGTTAEVSRAATRLLREIAPPPEREDGGRRILHGEKTTLSFTGPAAEMADIWATAKDNPLAWLTGSRAVAPASVTTNVIIELPDYLKILRGEGSEVRLAMTNGATITGADLLRRTLAGAGLLPSSTPRKAPSTSTVPATPPPSSAACSRPKARAAPGPLAGAPPLNAKPTTSSNTPAVATPTRRICAFCARTTIPSTAFRGGGGWRASTGASPGCRRIRATRAAPPRHQALRVPLHGRTRPRHRSRMRLPQSLLAARHAGPPPTCPKPQETKSAGPVLRTPR